MVDSFPTSGNESWLEYIGPMSLYEYMLVEMMSSGRVTLQLTSSTSLEVNCNG